MYWSRIGLILHSFSFWNTESLLSTPEINTFQLASELEKFSEHIATYGALPDYKLAVCHFCFLWYNFIFQKYFIGS